MQEPESLPPTTSISAHPIPSAENRLDQELVMAPDGNGSIRFLVIKPFRSWECLSISSQRCETPWIPLRKPPKYSVMLPAEDDLLPIEESANTGHFGSPVMPAPITAENPLPIETTLRPEPKLVDNTQRRPPQSQFPGNQSYPT
ncbi:hypothetical protein Q9L58_009686 [Maublancomyces gigas]|uniref:Uncharacterized protein n=1 Tax=Discina gigas TaxID=1032678 RepID=A0ABR3G6L1_9PEZI